MDMSDPTSPACDILQWMGTIKAKHKKIHRCNGVFAALKLRTLVG